MHPGRMLARRVLSVLPFVVLAYGGPLVSRNPKGNCDIGKMQCCQNVSTPNNPELSNLVSNPSLLNLLASLPVDTPIGMACSDAGAGSGAGCNSNLVCCENAVYQSGVINVGCVPLDLGGL